MEPFQSRGQPVVPVAITTAVLCDDVDRVCAKKGPTKIKLRFMCFFFSFFLWKKLFFLKTVLHIGICYWAPTQRGNVWSHPLLKPDEDKCLCKLFQLLGFFHRRRRRPSRCPWRVAVFIRWVIGLLSGRRRRRRCSRSRAGFRRKFGFGEVVYFVIYNRVERAPEDKTAAALPIS